jgi:hypothetical protein
MIQVGAPPWNVCERQHQARDQLVISGSEYVRDEEAVDSGSAT